MDVLERRDGGPRAGFLAVRREEGIQVLLLDHDPAALALTPETVVDEQTRVTPFVDQTVADADALSDLFRREHVAAPSGHEALRLSAPGHPKSARAPAGARSVPFAFE